MIRFSSAIFALAVVMFAFAAAQAWRGQHGAASGFLGAGLLVGILGFVKREDGE